MNKLIIIIIILLNMIINNIHTNKLLSPHILLIVVDDVGYADTTIYNNKTNIKTPFLENLGKTGIILNNYYVQPVCTPTRSALMTGKYPFRTGMQDRTTLLPGFQGHIPLNVKTLPEMLKKKNYQSHIIGKWHLGAAHEKYTPLGRGFLSHLGYYQGQIDYYTKEIGFAAFGQSNKTSKKNMPLTGLDFFRNNKPLFGTSNIYSLEIYQNHMKYVLSNYTEYFDTDKKKKENPLFLYMSYQTAHIPLQYNKEDKKSEICNLIKIPARLIYCKMMIELDNAIEELIIEFKNNNLWDNTLLLFTTDNGGM